MNDNEDDYADIPWLLHSSRSLSSRAERALGAAVRVAQEFDKVYKLYNIQREQMVPQFHPSELVLSQQPIRYLRLQTEYDLKEIVINGDGSFSEKKDHFASRVEEGLYSVKFLPQAIANHELATEAMTEMIQETKILMNLLPHPHINKIYGITSKGIDSLVVSGLKGYFYLTDRVSETLEERMLCWRRRDSGKPLISDRLDMALDIAAALVYLHAREIVYYVRPDKIAFDSRHGGIKLCDFGQARQHGVHSLARSLTVSDDIRVLAFTAPEVFSLSPANKGSDTYGFAVLLWEMMSLEVAFEGFNRSHHFQQVVVSKDCHLKVDNSWDASIGAMITACLQPHRRPTMRKVHLSVEAALLFQEPGNEIRSPMRGKELKPKKSDGNTLSLLALSRESMSSFEEGRRAPEPCEISIVSESSIPESLALEELMRDQATPSRTTKREFEPNKADQSRSSKTSSQKSLESKGSYSSKEKFRGGSEYGTNPPMKSILTCPSDRKWEKPTTTTSCEASSTTLTSKETYSSGLACDWDDNKQVFPLLGIEQELNEHEASIPTDFDLFFKPSTPEPDAHRPTMEFKRSSSFASIMFDEEPCKELKRSASFSSVFCPKEGADSNVKSDSSNCKPKEPKASESMPPVLTSPVKQNRLHKSTSRNEKYREGTPSRSRSKDKRRDPQTPSQRSSSKDRRHTPRTPSSRSHSKSPNGNGSSVKHSHSSGRQHSRKMSSSPHEFTEKDKHSRKRSSSRGNHDHVKRSVSMEELEQFLFSSGQMPTTPGGTAMKPKIIVRKPSIAKAKSEESLARCPVISGEQEHPSSPVAKQRPRKINLTEMKANTDFVVPITPRTHEASKNAMKQLRQSVESAPPIEPSTQLIHHSPMKRMMKGLKNITGVPTVKTFDSPPRQTMESRESFAATNLRTRRASVVMGLVDEHNQNRALSKEEQLDTVVS